MHRKSGCRSAIHDNERCQGDITGFLKYSSSMKKRCRRVLEKQTKKCAFFTFFLERYAKTYFFTVELSRSRVWYPANHFPIFFWNPRKAGFNTVSSIWLWPTYQLSFFHILLLIFTFLNYLLFNFTMTVTFFIFFSFFIISSVQNVEF